METVIVFSYKSELLGVVQDVDYSNSLEEAMLVEFITSKMDLLFSDELRQIEYHTDGQYTVTIRDNSIQIEFNADNGIINVYGYKASIVNVLTY